MVDFISTDTDRSDPAELPESVQELEFDQKKIYLVGTAHVSRKSVEDVRKAIEILRPDMVALELDESRYRNLIDKERWKKTNITSIIRRGEAMLLLSSLIMSSFQRRIGEKLGVKPGAELEEGVRAAADVEAEVVLIDRSIQTTLKRTWANLGLGGKIKMASQLAASLFIAEEIDEETIEALKKEEKLTDVLALLAEEFPMVKGPLIDERDQYMAQKLRDLEGRTVVAVVGAGHVPGIRDYIQREGDIESLETIPVAKIWGKVLKWLIPGVVIGLLVYGFLAGDAGDPVASVLIWVLINGILSALGAALAMGHPLTIVAAFFAAPLTSLNPLLAAGWVAGLVQAFVNKPTVEDLERLPEDIQVARGFWKNPVSRILLVVAFANIGSTLGTFIAGSWIAARVFG